MTDTINRPFAKPTSEQPGWLQELSTEFRGTVLLEEAAKGNPLTSAEWSALYDAHWLKVCQTMDTLGIRHDVRDLNVASEG